MRIWSVLVFTLACQTFVWASGTREVAPSPEDSIVMLETNRAAFGNFAAYNGPEDSRLAITIVNPDEVVYIGLSGEHQPDGTPYGLTQSRYEFRIVNEAGTVVHGPFTVDVLNANVSSWTEALYGNYDVSITQGGDLIYQFAPGQSGDYFVEFDDFKTNTGNPTDNTPQVTIGFWDFTVTLNDQPIEGRIWSRNWAFRTPPRSDISLPDCEWNRPFNGVLYSYTTDRFVSKIDFSQSGFQGLSFNVAFNSTGPGNTGDLEMDRQSIPGFNATAFSAEHRIFLHEPDPVAFPDGECGTITPSATFNCAGIDGFCLNVTVSDPGQVEIVIDFNQNGQFDPDSEDVTLVWNFEPGDLTACVPWDGLRGDGTMVAFGDVVDLLFVYTRGVQHYAVYDQEFLKNGYCVETVRPICGVLNDNRLFWDDREIPEESGTGQPKDGRAGCECGVDNCRSWTNFNVNVASCELREDALTTGYGDKNTLNTWWFASSSLITRADIPILSCQVTGDAFICEGTTAELMVEVSGSANVFTYSWSGPGGFTSTAASTGPLTIPGEYCVTVTNPNSCETVCCQTIELADGPTLSLMATNASCDAAADGSISASATDGTEPYEFSIDGGAFQDSGNFTGLTAGDYEVTVQDAQGCTDMLTVSIGVLDEIDIEYPENLELCFGDSEQITFTGDPTGLDFSWSPSQGVSDPTSPNPIFSPSVTTVYTVTISQTTAPECQIQQQVTVAVTAQINPQVSGDLTTCAAETTLTASSDIPATFTWLDANGDVLATGPTLTVPVSGFTNYTLRAVDDDGCAEERDFVVSGGPVDVALADTVAACLGEQIELNVVNLDAGDVLSYDWTPADLFEGGTDTANPDYIETIGTNQVFVTITNQFGCTYQDSVQVAVLDPNATYSFDSELQCDGATVIFTNTSTGAFDFIWTFGDGTTSTEVSPSHVYSEAGTYIVQLTTVYDASCAATAVEEITVSEPELLAGFTYEIVACDPDGATIAFTDTSFISVGTITSWMWTFSDDQTSTQRNPIFTFAEGELTVTLKVTSNNGCEAETEQTIDIELVDIDLAEQIILCPGDSVGLNPNGDPTYLYSWTPAEGLDDPTAANPMASPMVTTEYTVTVRNTAGSDTCTVTDQITVLVPAPINLDLGDDVTTCGEDVTLTANADVGVSVQWTSTTDGDIGQGTTVTVNPFRRDTIIATATDANGCTEVDTVVVIDQGVDVTTDPLSPITACSGLETTISIINQDDEDVLTYEWSPADNIVSGAGTATVSVMVESGSVDFQAIVSNQFGCNDTVTVTVSVVPFEPNLPETVTACADIPTPLNPDFNETYTYEWSPGTGLSDPNSGNPIFTGDMTTVYTVTVTDDSQGILCQTTAEVTVVVAPDIDLMTSGDTALCEVATVTLQATTAIDVPITWYDDEGLTNVIGMGNSVDVTPQAGTNVYTAIAGDAMSGCADTSTVTVTLNDITDHLPPVMFDVCAGATLELNPNGDPNLEYDWQPTDNLDLDTNGPHNPIFVGSDTTVYELKVTDPETGCMLTQTVTVAVFPPINLQTSGDTAICEIVPVTLQATTDIDVPITWYDDEGLTNVIGMGTEVTVTPLMGNNTYTVIAVDAATGCADTSTVSVNVVDITDSLPPTTVDACPDMPTELNPNGDPNLVYVWEPATDLDLVTNGPHNPIFNGVDTTIYNVTVTDPESLCMLTQMVTVNVPPTFTVEAAGDTTLCEAAAIPLTVVSDTTGITFVWYDNPDGMEPSVGQGASIMVTPPSDTTVYTVIGTDAAGCTQSDSVTVIVAPIMAEITPPQTLCEPTDAVTLMVTNLDTTQVLTYQWSPENAVDPTTGPLVTANPNLAETFSVTITNEAGCEQVLTTTVTIADLSELEISADPMEICVGEPTQITVTGCDDCTYTWEAPSGTITPTNGPVVTATPDEAGENVYTVTVDKDGCTETLSISISVLEIICSGEYFFIPNAFTPNGDNINDVLRMRSNFSEKLTSYELMIYNRWGEEVFRTTDPFAEWDGTYKGRELPPDVYGYWMQIDCPGGEELRKQGNISLLK